MKVSIGNNKGWLRLRWQYQETPYSLNVGLQDSPTNRAYAHVNLLSLEALSLQRREEKRFAALAAYFFRDLRDF